METELRGSDDLMTDAVLHLFEAGGKRFRPLFAVLSAQLGPNPDSGEVADCRRRHRIGAPGHAVPRRRDGRGASAPRRTQRQPAMEQQRRDPGRRLPVRHRVAAGVAAGPGRGADHRRDVRPAGHRADARNPGRRRQSRPDRALPEGGPREDGLPDRRGRPVRRDVLRRRRTTRPSGSAGSATWSARRSRSPTTSSTSTATRTSPASCPAPTCAKACTRCRCSTRCTTPDPDADRLRELLAGPIEDDAELAEALRCCGPRRAWPRPRRPLRSTRRRRARSWPRCPKARDGTRSRRWSTTRSTDTASQRNSAAAPRR